MRRLFIPILMSIIMVQYVAAQQTVGFSAQVPSPARQSSFSAPEQQQISIETPGLFDKSQTFQIDFAAMPAAAYSFPLPVGKVLALQASKAGAKGIHSTGSGQVGQDVVIETKKGDAVKAMFDGVVRLSRRTPNFGNVIVIRHNNGLETVYGYNAENLVKSGDRVKAGQTIAIVGASPPALPHMEGAASQGKGYLVFSIMVNGGRINPAMVLDLQKHTLRRATLTFTKEGSHVKVQGKRAFLNHGRTAPQYRATENPVMDLETNNPFQDKAVYRLNLNLLKQGQWHYPLDDSHVISGYGGARGHAGVDIKNGPGTNVYAAFDGKVVQSGNFAGYGKCITIRHTNGLETRYSHNSKNYVQVGEMVKAGQIIGKVGRTGRATTEHLHFETRIAGRAFNPEYVFDHKNHTIQHGTLQFKKSGSVVRLK